jgi:hypothetical protein
MSSIDKERRMGSENRVELKSNAIAAESDVRTALEAVQMKLQHELQIIPGNNDSSNVGSKMGLVKRRLLNDCSNHLADVIRRAVHTIKDDDFHKHVYDAKQLQLQQSGSLCTETNDVGDVDANNSDDDDCSSSIEIDDEDLVDAVAVEQVHKLREQLRMQARINSKKRATYMETISRIVEIEQMIFVKEHSELQKSVSNGSNYESNVRDVDGAKEKILDQYKSLLQELQERVASVKESLVACDESTVNAASDRMSETIQEVQRNFSIQEQQVDPCDAKNGHGLSMLLTQPLSQVEEAIARREDDKELEIELVKKSILYSKRANTEATTQTVAKDQYVSDSPQKDFLDMVL